MSELKFSKPFFNALGSTLWAERVQGCLVSRFRSVIAWNIASRHTDGPAGSFLARVRSARRLWWNITCRSTPRFLNFNFDVEVDKARFRATAALSPSDGLGSLGHPSVLVIDEAQSLPETSRIIQSLMTCSFIP